MIDTEYRDFVIENLHYIETNMFFLTNDEYEPIHHHAWLTLMGLIETWDVTQ